MNNNVSHSKINNLIKISFVVLLSVMITFSYMPAIADTNIHFPGKVYYVSTTGSDENDGSIDSPWRTIQYAVHSLKAGETVMVRGGTYEESIMIKNSGSASAGYITIQAYPGEIPILDLTNLHDNSTIVDIYGAHYIVFDGFELRGLKSDSSSKYLAAIKMTKGSSNIYILNNTIHDIGNFHVNGNANGIIAYGDSVQAIENIKIFSRKGR